MVVADYPVPLMRFAYPGLSPITPWSTLPAPLLSDEARAQIVQKVKDIAVYWDDADVRFSSMKFLADVVVFDGHIVQIVLQTF